MLMRTTILIITLVAVLAGCTGGSSGNSGTDERITPNIHRGTDERFVRPGQPRTSPSGEFVAHAEPEPGPEQSGASAWIVVITDHAGREVFRSTEASHDRPGVDITWLTDTDELWVLSPDAGPWYVQQDGDDTWSRERPRQDHRDEDVPAEIRELAGHAGTH